MKTIFSRHCATLAGAVLAVAELPAASLAAEPAARFPARPMKIVVPFPAGGYSDALARLVATDMTTAFGLPVVVENRPGAGGNIGADAVAKSAPDGHVLVMGTIGTQVINPLIYKRMPYRADRDFTPVAFVADAETVLVVHPSLHVGSVKELIARAREKPGGLTFASGGTGTTGHLAGELFKAVTGTSITHVPYKGNVPAITDVVGGQVSMSFATAQPALPFIRGGQLIALATMGTVRTAALPQIPTFAEAGVQGVEVRNWTGLLAPAGTPLAVRQMLAAQVDKTLQSPSAHSMLAAQGLNYTRMGPDAFGSFIRGESAKWEKVVREAGIQAD